MNQTKRILFVTYPGASLLDYSGPAGVFSTVNELQPACAAYEIHCLSVTGGAIAQSSGLTVVTQALSGFRFLPEDTLLVTGAPDAALHDARLDPQLKQYLIEAKKTCSRFGSICTGALILADAGLLSGVQACTHWASQAALQKAAPDSRVNFDALFTVDGSLWMSAGVTTGIDMALAMVEHDRGQHVRSLVAKHLLVYAQRSGHQTQFSDILLTQTKTDARFTNLINWLIDNIQYAIKVEDMAEFMSMSPRSFYRHFYTTFDQAPGEFLRKIRLDHARMLLTSGESVEQVAGKVGFKSVAAFRTAFKDYIGIPPRQYAGMENSNPLKP